MLNVFTSLKWHFPQKRTIFLPLITVPFDFPQAILGNSVEQFAFRNFNNLWTVLETFLKGFLDICPRFKILESFG